MPDLGVVTSALPYQRVDRRGADQTLEHGATVLVQSRGNAGDQRVPRSAGLGDRVARQVQELTDLDLHGTPAFTAVDSLSLRSGETR